MFVCTGAVPPRPSRECDITFFAKGRPKSARQSRDSTVCGAHCAERHRNVIPGVTRMLGKKKPIDINILGGTVSGTNGTPSLGQTGPHPWDKLGPVPGTNRPSCVYFHGKLPFCPVCPWDGWGVVLGRLSRKGREKNVYVFFFSQRTGKGAGRKGPRQKR